MSYAEFIERHLLTQLSEALAAQDEWATVVARYELREFYKSLGMHP
jgi:hypothetical protein